MRASRLFSIVALCSALALFGVLSSGCKSSDKNSDGGPNPEAGTGTGDGGGDAVGPVGETTIFKVTDGSVSEGSKVLIKGVVITAIDAFGDPKDDIYVQDPKGGKGSGIKLFRAQRIDGGNLADLKPGDVVDIEGEVKYFSPSGGFNDTRHPNKTHIKEIDNAKLTFIKSDTVPAPAEVAATELTDDPDAEGWEGVLVTVKDVRVTEGKDPQYGEWKVEGGLDIGNDLYEHTPTVGDCVSVTGISLYFYAYRLQPRSDKDIVASTSCKQPTALTIKDIQDDAAANHPTKGDLVKFTGTVTAVDGRLSGTTPRYYGFWVQDGQGAFSGIQIFHSWDDQSAIKPVEGETYEITGTYDEYFGVSQIKGVTWTKVADQTAPTPEDIADASTIATNGADAEKFEGVLVKITNAEVLESVKDSKGKVVGIKLKTSNLHVDADLYDFATNPPAAGKMYKSITGVLHYSFDNFKILPRKASDFEE
ncbi:MAG: hypothetical protein KC503_36900 [Myxococcales bacterium]|nr:hypothetical protein [Myxococcales bacterium]